MLPAVSNDSRVGQEGPRCVERAVALPPADVQRVGPGTAAGPLGAAAFGLPGASTANTLECTAS